MCEGTGAIRPSILLSDEVEAHLKYILNEQNEKVVQLHMHPFLAAYFTNGYPSKRVRWWLKYKRWVKVVPENNYHMGEYHFFNAAGEQISI
jgi:ribonuclease G